MTYQVVVSDVHMIRPEAIRDHLGDAAEATFAELGSVEALVAECEAVDADAAITDVATPVPAAVFETLDLSVVARAAVGFDNIDVSAAADAGVTVTHVPGYCTDEVATQALALLLACVRAVREYDESVRRGEWAAFPSRNLHRLRGRTLGFVSFGAIGRRLAELTSGFGVDAVAYDPYLDESETEDVGVDVELVGFEELLERSDYVSVNAPATPETRGMFDADAFSRMRAESILVNTGRGAVVDEDALVSALDAGEIGAAGLDVFESEPLSPESPLTDREDVVLSPHAGWYSEESIEELNRRVASDVRRVLRGETPESPVDPEWA
ncbi:D-3-phosphoglycerate dehydrogenase [Halopelagius inordinatus]|uniref:D-3-phosphoglycerate dehydrogenase n=1 Tax=Halopelagius inordinatus TaxID=553467 RepID=A0A1I2MA76_9EURY|nr:C-terminal binding protein [Halopelagius inordinatus]SFF87830.1 D-3-phosphoglycerate dehydrogenase [Halopelagius inordinatus]